MSACLLARHHELHMHESHKSPSTVGDEFLTDKDGHAVTLARSCKLKTKLNLKHYIREKYYALSVHQTLRGNRKRWVLHMEVILGISPHYPCFRYSGHSVLCRVKQPRDNTFGQDR